MTPPLLRTFLLLFLSGFFLPLQAQDAASSPSTGDEPAGEAGGSDPATTGDTDIPVDHLGALLVPLTRSELEAEAEGWRDLLKESATRIAELEVEGGEADAGGGSEAMAKLRSEKEALGQRLATVLDALEAKGGDTEEYRLYLAAALATRVDLLDGSSVRSSLGAWLASETGGRLVLRNLLIFAAVLVVFYGLSWCVGILVRPAVNRNPRFSGLLKRFINRMIRRVVLLVGVLVALSMIGVNIGALLALVGGGAFIIGFALQDTLGNLASGIMVLVNRPFDVGDVVSVGGVDGKVEGVSLVSTTISTPDNKCVLVPNKSVWGQVITNASANPERRVDLVFGISYDDDMKQARDILLDIVREHELVLDDPEPVVRVHELADSSVNLVCRPWVKRENYWDVYWDITEKVKAAFDANGISIPYPQQYVHYAKGAENVKDVASE